MKFKFTLLSLLLMCMGYAQVTNQGKPYSWKLNDIEQVMPVKMPSFDLRALEQEDIANANVKNKPWRFGYEFLVDYNLSNSGKWTTLENGDRIWRIRFKSTGAKTLNFLFSDFYMPEGGKVYLYNNDRTDLLGAYDSQQNNEQRVLGTWLVKGDDIWIEYFEPAASTGQGKLEIFKVVHGYRTVADMAKDPDDGLNTSGNCNYDVNCFMEGIDDLKDINKKAVAVIITNNSTFCSGALVNNTSNNGTPYFLTANHCYSDPAEWAFRFNWISTNPVCASTTNSTSNTNYYQTASGAVLRARREQSDFCLVEINANLPSSWDLVWAGWNRSETPAASTFGIHHPSGDIMKACRDLNPPVLTTEGGSAMWEVMDWDLGVTEGGSSGSPLFDQNGRIIGQLFGGGAACNGLTDNGQPDYYGRFGVSWNGGSTTATRLKEWLDPANTNAVTLNAYPPQEVFPVNAKVIIADLAQQECSAIISPIITLVNKGSQTLTSATITYTLNGTPAVLNWTGNLITEASQNIALPTLEGESGENTFVVVVTMPNGTTDAFPADNTVNEGFTVAVYEVANVALQINTDAFGEETSWNLQNQDGTILYSGGNYAEFATINQTFNLTEEGCYTFTINDSADDGICCDYGNGSYSLTIEGQTIVQGGAFGSSESTTFRLDDELSSEEYNLQALLKIYPNPSSGIFTISGYESAVDYNLYNVLGQQIRSGRFEAGNGNLDISGVANGVYILTVIENINGIKANYKLVKE